MQAFLLIKKNGIQVERYDFDFTENPSAFYKMRQGIIGGEVRDKRNGCILLEILTLLQCVTSQR